MKEIGEILPSHKKRKGAEEERWNSGVLDKIN